MKNGLQNLFCFISAKICFLCNIINLILCWPVWALMQPWATMGDTPRTSLVIWIQSTPDPTSCFNQSHMYPAWERVALLCIFSRKITTYCRANIDDGKELVEHSVSVWRDAVTYNQWLLWVSVLPWHSYSLVASLIDCGKIIYIV